MLDREFALRFIAFYELPLDEYKGSIDFFLNKAMEYINQKYDDIYACMVEELYIQSLTTVYEIFEKFAFRKMPDMGKRRQVNKALFEVWTVLLARKTRKQQQKLIEKRVDVLDTFMVLCRDDKEFNDSLKSSKIAAVKRRFERIESLIGGILEK